MPSQGAIVLIPVPFTDLTALKRRPVIVVSNDAYQQATPDMIVVAMTSNPTYQQYTFMITTADLIGGDLNRPGFVRVDKIYTLAQSLVVKTFGRVNPATIERIRAQLQEVTARTSEPPH